MGSAHQEEVHRRGVRLEVFTITWNVVEAFVAIGAGLLAGSVGFGVARSWPPSSTGSQSWGFGGRMMVVAVMGLLVNVAGTVDMQGAIRHIFAVLLGSVGVIAAALVIVLTGQSYADP